MTAEHGAAARPAIELAGVTRLGIACAIAGIVISGRRS